MTILGDEEIENDEVFALILEVVSGKVTLVSSNATVTIENDDGKFMLV